MLNHLHFPQIDFYFDDHEIEMIMNEPWPGLWKMIRCPAQEQAKGERMYIKHFGFALFGTRFEFSFYLDRPGTELIPSPTAEYSSPTTLPTGKTRRTQARGTIQAIQRLLPQLGARNARQVSDYSYVLLWCQLTGQASISPGDWDTMRPRAKRKIIAQAKSFARKQ